MAENLDTNRIVVGVDGSASSIAALRYASRLATALDTGPEAVTVWSFPAFGEPVVLVEWAPQRDAAEVLDASIRSAFGDSPPEGLVRTVLPGPPRTLIGLSRHCGMLVVGTRGHGGFAGLLLGSVSTACAEHAHCPILIMHSRKDTEESV